MKKLIISIMLAISFIGTANYCYSSDIVELLRTKEKGRQQGIQSLNTSAKESEAYEQEIRMEKMENILFEEGINRKSVNKIRTKFKASNEEIIQAIRTVNTLNSLIDQYE